MLCRSSFGLIFILLPSHILQLISLLLSCLFSLNLIFLLMYGYHLLAISLTHFVGLHEPFFGTYSHYFSLSCWCLHPVSIFSSDARIDVTALYTANFWPEYLFLAHFQTSSALCFVYIFFRPEPCLFMYVQMSLLSFLVTSFIGPNHVLLFADSCHMLFILILSFIGFEIVFLLACSRHVLSVTFASFTCLNHFFLFRT